MRPLPHPDPADGPADEDTPAGRIVGWYRPDVSTRIWLFLPACILLTALGALLVGYGYGRLERADPVGIHRDARSFEERVEKSGAIGIPHERGQGEDLGAMWAFFAVGLALVASGPGLAIVFLRRLWLRDDFLLLRTDSLVASIDGREDTIAWYDIEAVRFDREGAVVRLEMRAGTSQVLEPRLVDDAESLARRLEEVRRKAIWDLLPEQR